MACVYGLVSTKEPNEVRYIGMTKYDTPDRRLAKHHEHALCSSINRPVYDWMRKHIRSGHSINAVVLQITSREDASYVEKSLIAEYKRLGKSLLNSTEGGEGVVGYSHSEESRNKMKDAWVRRKKEQKTITLSLETKMKISAAMSGRKQSPDHTRKIVESRKKNKKNCSSKSTS